MRNPIIISGLRKSGTSMVRNLLDSHPAFFVHPINELHFFDFTHYRKATERSRPGSGSDPNRSIAERIEDICANKWFNLAEGGGTSAPIDYDAFHERLRTSGAHDYPSLLEAILVAAAESCPAFAGRKPEDVRFVYKGVQQSEFVPELRQWFPDMQFIYVLRSPYGQINSAINNLRHGKKGIGKKREIARDHKKLDRSLAYPFLGPRLRQMKQSYFFMRKWAELYPANFYVLVYDRLLADPEDEMRKLAEFLGIEFTPGLLTLTECGKPKVRSGWSVGRHETSEISTGPITAWQEQLSPHVVRLVNMHFTDVLEDYGFEVASSGASLWRRMDRAERLKTYLANRLLYTRWASQLLI